MLSKIKKACFHIASFGPLGSIPLGRLFATLFAIPVVYGFDQLISIYPKLWVIWIASLFCFVYLILFYAHQDFTLPSSQQFVIDSFLGYFVALLFLPLKIKFALFGLIMFHAILIFDPIKMLKARSIHPDDLPTTLILLFDDLIAGVLVNFFFKLVLWLAH